MSKPSKMQLELASLARRDSLSWGILYLNLLHGRKWDVAGRLWAPDMYAAVNPWIIERYPVGEARRLVIQKATQVGISTTALTKMFHFTTNWPVRIFYTLPRQQDVLDFVTTRIDPMIAQSPYLRSLLHKPDSAHAKGLGDSYLFFMELSVEPRMMPADALYVDEYDLSDPDFASTAVNRLDASNWKLQMFLSTPTVPNYGINGMWSISDMREWLVKCPQCNHEQPLDWEINLRYLGPANNPTKVYYGCAKCDRELTISHIQTGRWVAKAPERSYDTIGFHVHQMLTHPAWELYNIYRDPQTRLVEFYRKRLGKPYEIGGGSLERDDILASCFDELYDFEPGYDGQSTYYLGADQGNEIQVLVAKLLPNSQQFKIVHIEIVPISKGFDRISQLIKLYHVRKAVIDANPNRHEAIRQVRRFPGKVLIADYIEQKEIYTPKRGLKEFPKILTTVTINRTGGFDALMDTIKRGQWQLPGTPPDLHPDTELLIDHVTALKRDIQTRRTQSGEVEAAVWVKLRAEHLAHAWLYLKTAADIDRSRGARIAVIGVTTSDTKETPAPTDQPDSQTIKAILSLLAEVPAEQISQFLADENNELPFPLSYKLGKAKKEFELDDILWVMRKGLTEEWFTKKLTRKK